MLFKKIEFGLRIIGYIADITAIVSILWALKLPNAGQVLPSLITPGFALAIWVIGAYLIISYLHRYWEDTKDQHHWGHRFLTFLIKDLIIQFRAPFRLIPGFIWIIVLVGILHSSGVLGGVIGALACTTFIVAVTSPLWWHVVRGRILSSINTKENQALVEEKWDDLRQIIDTTSVNNPVISSADLREVMIVLGLTEGAIEYAFVKYAAASHGEFRYGTVYSLATGENLVYGALVHMPRLDQKVCGVRT